jgi:hypothetical protein
LLASGCIYPSRSFYVVHSPTWSSMFEQFGYYKIWNVIFLCILMLFLYFNSSFTLFQHHCQVWSVLSCFKNVAQRITTSVQFSGVVYSPQVDLSMLLMLNLVTLYCFCLNLHLRIFCGVLMLIPIFELCIESVNIVLYCIFFISFELILWCFIPYTHLRFLPSKHCVFQTEKCFNFSIVLCVWPWPTFHSSQSTTRSLQQGFVTLCFSLRYAVTL